MKDLLRNLSGPKVIVVHGFVGTCDCNGVLDELAVSRLAGYEIDNNLFKECGQGLVESYGKQAFTPI